MTARPSRPGSAPHPRRSLGSLAVALLIVGVFAAVVGITLAMGRSTLDSAIHTRVEDRQALMERFGAAGEQVYRTPRALEVIDDLELSPTDPIANAQALAAVTTSPSGQAILASAVVDRDGTTIGSQPADIELPTDEIATAVAAAIESDSVVTTPVFDYRGQPAWAVVRATGDEPWGAVAMVEPLRRGWIQTLYEPLGAFGAADGGLTLIDVNGVVVASWVPERVGTVVWGADVRARWRGDHVVEEVTVDGRSLTRIIDQGAHGSNVLVYEEPTASFTGDLRAAQRQRDLTVILAAGGALAALAGLGVLRHRAVRRSEARAAALLGHARDVVLVVLPDGTIDMASPSVGELLGHEPDTVLHRRIQDLTHNDDSGRVTQALERAQLRETASVLGVRLRDATGDHRWFDLLLECHDAPDLRGIVVTCHESGDRKALEDELAYRARHDSLTGLGNRSVFDAEIGAVTSSGPCAVVMIDLDSFKPLNDALGHDAGDAALRAVADSLRQRVRANDVLCRLGGDEFGIICPAIDRAAATALADRVIDTVRDVWPPIDESTSLDASVGVALVVGPTDRPETVVRAADEAMYRAKRSGGGRVELVEIDPVPPSDSPPTATSRTPDDAPVTARPETAPRVADQDGSGWHHDRSPWAIGATWALSLAITLALVGVGALAGQSATDDLEDRRVAERGELLLALNGPAGQLSDMTGLSAALRMIPWSFEDPEASAPYLDLIATSPTAGTGTTAHLLTADGRTLAASPTGRPPAVDLDDASWDRVLTNTPVSAPVRTVDGEPRSHILVPLPDTDGRVGHVLAIGFELRSTGWSDNYAKIGSLGPGPGGVSIVDVNGVASVSWDPDRLGQQIVDPALLRDVEVGDVRSFRGQGVGGDDVVIVTRIPNADLPAYQIWVQDGAGLFADLRAGRAERDLGLIGVLLIAVAATTVVTRRREALVKRVERRLDALLHGVHDVIVLLDGSRTVQFANSALTRVLGYRRGQVLGHRIDEVLDPAVADQNGQTIESVLTQRSGSLRGYPVPSASGLVRHFDVHAEDLRHHPGLRGRLLTCHEVSERMALESLLHAQAHTDPLTGLANRSQFSSRLDDIADDPGPRTDAVAFIDLDHFKPVNDEFGHHVGDHLLRTIADRLTAVVRADDLVCRLGGDEFAVLIVDSDLELASATVDRLLAAIREPVKIGAGVVRLDASIGLALSTSGIGNPEQLVREADQAMYRAKRAGRGRYEVDV
ncbi:MAG: diguanylate cyclase domain-containing protein [Acidimicrobiales bacterium]